MLLQEGMKVLWIILLWAWKQVVEDQLVDRLLFHCGSAEGGIASVAAKPGGGFCRGLCRSFTDVWYVAT